MGARLATVLLVSLLLTGCEFVDSQILKGAREYFPRAELVRPHRQVVHLETHVGNITRKFAAEAFRAMHQQKGRDLGIGLSLAGYRWMILGFDDFNVVWDTSSQQFWVLDSREFGGWQLQVFGRKLPYPAANRFTGPSPATPGQPSGQSVSCGSNVQAARYNIALNEAGVTGTLRTLNTAEATFAATYNRGFTYGLNRLGPPGNGAISENGADLVDAVLAGLCPPGTNFTFERYGFRFVYVPNSRFGHIASYTLTARPSEYGRTGTRSFFTDESGVIRWTREDRWATAEDMPL
jgi:hypothetical protein